MKVLPRWHWSAVLLAAAMSLPAGLAAQTAATPPPNAVWIARSPGQNDGPGRRSVLRVFDLASPDSGWLGISISEVTPADARQAKLAKDHGVLVKEVEPESPAAKAGLKAGDVIVRYNGQSVEGVLQFRRLVRETPPGRTASLEVWRDGRSQTLSASIGKPEHLRETRLLPPGDLMGEMPDIRMSTPMPREFRMFRRFAPHPLLGVEAEEVSGQLGKYFEVPGDRGILVVSVTPGSAAEKAGLKAGDVIYQVAGKPVHSVDRLEQALRDNCTANGVSLGVVRKGATLVQRVPIQCPQPPGGSTSSATTQ